MSRTAIEDQKFEVIKGHILDPENSPLPEHLHEMFNRTLDASKILEKNPVQKHAVAILRAKYPDVSRSQAYEDCNRAQRIFNTIHTLDYDYWQWWLLQDIAEMINKAKERGDMKAWAMGHKNLRDVLGEKPETQLDPKLIEKHNFNIYLQINNQTVSVDMATFMKLPLEARTILTGAVYEEIDTDQAIHIMKT